MTSLRLLSCMLAAWLPAAGAGQALTLTLADGHDFVRYGQTLDYVVTLTNDGDAAAAVPVSVELSPAWDPAGASWVCYPGTDGATCAASGSGPLNDLAMLPPGARVSWVVSVPTRPDTLETIATLAVVAPGAATVSDANALVVFKDGFDVPYGDGTQELSADGM
jgi:hypothetical protein